MKSKTQPLVHLKSFAKAGSSFPSSFSSVEGLCGIFGVVSTLSVVSSQEAFDHKDSSFRTRIDCPTQSSLNPGIPLDGCNRSSKGETRSVSEASPYYFDYD